MRKFKIFLINGDYIISEGQIPYAITTFNGLLTLNTVGKLYQQSNNRHLMQITKNDNIVFYPHSVLAVIEI